MLFLKHFSFKEWFSNGIVEGFNLKAKLTRGFKRFKTIEIALFRTLGHLPKPLATHRFY